MSVYVCIWGFLAMLSRVSYSPVTSNPAVGPVLKPWRDSPCGTSTKMVTKWLPVNSVEKVLISFSSPGRLNTALTFLCIPES